jgi:hypothetical protein
MYTDELNAKTSAAIVNIRKDILHRIRKEVDYTRIYIVLIVKCFKSDIFSTWVLKKASTEEWNIANNTLIFISIPNPQVPEIPAIFSQMMYPVSILRWLYCPVVSWFVDISEKYE